MYPFTLNTWKTASSSIFQSTFPLTLLQPRKNSCCFKSYMARQKEVCEPQCGSSKKGVLVLKRLSGGIFWFGGCSEPRRSWIKIIVLLDS